MTRRQPTRDDHRRFCVVEGWTEIRNARGKAVRHHETYELSLPDRAVLRTPISRPPDRTTYDPAMWRHILGEQLKVTDEDFWACVLKGERPDRGIGKAQDSRESIPVSLVHQLLHEVRLSEEEVAQMSREQAVARMQQHWSRPQ
jgi:hypothetical protein